MGKTYKDSGKKVDWKNKKTPKRALLKEKKPPRHKFSEDFEAEEN